VPIAVPKQRGSVKTGIAAKDDLDIRKRFLEPFRKISKDGNGTKSTTFICGTQLGPKKLVAAKKVDRQEAIIVVKLQKVSPLLIAMNKIIGRIDIDDDLFRRRVVGLDEEFDKDFVEITHLLFGDAIFESRERWSRAERLVFIGRIFDGGEQGGICSQAIVIIDIFVSESDTENALGDEIALLMGDVGLITRVVDYFVDAIEETEFSIDKVEENGSAIGGEPATAEINGEGFERRVEYGNGGWFLIHSVLVL